MGQGEDSMKTLVGVFATPLGLGVMIAGDDLGGMIISACLVGLLWVGIVAWKRHDRPKPASTGAGEA